MTHSVTSYLRIIKRSYRVQDRTVELAHRLNREDKTHFIEKDLYERHGLFSPLPVETLNDEKEICEAISHFDIYYLLNNVGWFYQYLDFISPVFFTSGKVDDETAGKILDYLIERYQIKGHYDTIYSVLIDFYPGGEEYRRKINRYKLLGLV